jgi:hypothetical protein
MARISSASVFLVGLLLPVAANGQSGAAPPATRSETLQIELTNTIRAKNAKVGDIVKARTVTALVLPNQTVVPENAKLIGRVCAANPEPSDANGAAIAIVFDEMRVRNGKKLQLNLSIQAAMLPRPSLPRGMEEQDSQSLAQPGASPHAATKQKSLPVVGFSSSGRPNTVPEATPGSQIDAKGTVDNRGELRALPAGTLIGMPGVTLVVDGPAGAATFHSSNRKLELKSGLQLQLRVNP